MILPERHLSLYFIVCEVNFTKLAKEWVRVVYVRMWISYEIGNT